MGGTELHIKRSSSCTFRIQCSRSHHHSSRPRLWWQLIETWKKLVLVGFFALLKPGSMIQTISAFVVSATFSLLVGVAAPYKDASDDYFAKACSYALTMLFFFVTVLKMGVLTEQVDSVLTDELRYRFSFDAAFVSAGMVVSIIGTLPLAAVMAAHRLLQRAQIGEAARFSESSAASTVRQSDESLVRAGTSLRSRSTRRSYIPQECSSQERILPGNTLGTSAKAFNLKRALNLRLSRTHGIFSVQSAGNEWEAAMAVHATNAPYGKGRPPAAMPVPASSQGKLRASDVEEPPTDRKARLKARRDSLTAGDELFEDSSGTKEGPGRVSRCTSSSKRASSSCSASSPKDRSSCGASTSHDDNESVRV